MTRKRKSKRKVTKKGKGKKKSFRSAISGRYETKKAARRWPTRSVAER